VLERVSPSPVSERWRIRRLTILKAWLMLAKMVLPFVVQGGGAQVPRSADFLVMKGSLPFQGFGGGAAGFAGAAFCSKTTMPELRRASL
jgi:hypothetical protein